MNSDDRILVLADDLTGALEVGAKFGQRGVPTKVTTEAKLSALSLGTRVQVLVIDTETRHLPSAEAAAKVFILARAAYSRGFAHVYKKTDSTLRGNIASELDALLKACPSSSLIYVPAYPRMGRIVRRGTLYVHGIPTSQTDFADDELNAVGESHIPTLIGSRCSTPVFSIGYDAVERADSPAVYVCDAETDEQIAHTAAAFARSDQFHLAAGPAAFAGSLAEYLVPSQPSPALPRNLRSGLVVSGSRSKASVEQLKHAAQNGFTVAGAAEIPSILNESRWAILKLADRLLETATDFAGRTGKIVCELLAQKQPDVLVVFGGDTAYSVIRAVGHPSISPLGEVMEGIPLSDIEAGAEHRSRNFRLITKAGGFGPPDVLVTIRKIVSGK